MKFEAKRTLESLRGISLGSLSLLALGLTLTAQSDAAVDRELALHAAPDGLRLLDARVRGGDRLDLTLRSVEEGDGSALNVGAPRTLLAHEHLPLGWIDGLDLHASSTGTLRIVAAINGGGSRLVRQWFFEGTSPDADALPELRTTWEIARLALDESVHGAGDQAEVHDLMDPQLLQWQGRTLLLGSGVPSYGEFLSTGRVVFLAELPEDGSAPSRAKILVDGTGPRLVRRGEGFLLGVRRPRNARELDESAPLVLLASEDLVRWTEIYEAAEPLLVHPRYALSFSAGRAWATSPDAEEPAQILLQRFDESSASWSPAAFDAGPRIRLGRDAGPTWLLPSGTARPRLVSVGPDLELRTR